MRLDKYLQTHYGYSRNFLQHLIKAGAVEVNGKIVTRKSFEVGKEDNVQIKNPNKFLSTSVLEHAKWEELPILKETNERVVIYKPAGVLSHPGSSWDLSIPSVAAWAWNRYRPQINYYGNNKWEFLKAGLVHRLDKDTSGLMLITKTQRSLEYFQNLFKQKSEGENSQLKKYYKAVVWAEEKGKQFLNSISGSRFVIDEIVKPKNVPLKEFKRGITIVESFKSLSNNFYLLNIQLITGRTHQIRYHLWLNGLKIVGDPLYGIKKNINLNSYFSHFFKGNMGLESYRLEFEDMNGTYINIVI